MNPPLGLQPVLLVSSLLTSAACGGAGAANVAAPGDLDAGLGADAMEASVTERQPDELGQVRWQRDHEAAFAAAKQGSKPVVLLFQEIPG